MVPPTPAVVAPDGVVTRPANGAGDATVRLTATVTVGTATTTRAFDLTVRQLPKAEPYAGYAFAYFTGNSVSGEKSTSPPAAATTRCSGTSSTTAPRC